MRIIKITDGFVTNSSSYNGTMVLATRKNMDLKDILPMVGIPSSEYYVFNKYKDEYDIEIEDLIEEYNIFEVSRVIYAYGDDYVEEAEVQKDELRDYILKIEYTRDRIYLLNSKKSKTSCTPLSILNEILVIDVMEH
ncbi:MAG: hypothetical protein ACFFEN_13145 [Candidatus Thorarchaeota archaeon]